MKKAPNIKTSQQPVNSEDSINVRLAERMNIRIARLLNQEEESNNQSFKNYDKQN